MVQLTTMILKQTARHNMPHWHPYVSLIVFLSLFDRIPVKVLIEFNLVQIQRQIPKRITVSFSWFHRLSILVILASSHMC